MINQNKKTEILDVDANNWSEAEDYPFAWGSNYFIMFLSFPVYPLYKPTNVYTWPRSFTSAARFTCLVENQEMDTTRRQSVDSTLKRANGLMSAISRLGGKDTMQFTTGNMCSLLEEREPTKPRSAR